MKKLLMMLFFGVTALLSNTAMANNFLRTNTQVIQYLIVNPNNPYCYVGGETGAAENQIFRIGNRIYIFYVTSGYKYDGICSQSNGAVNWRTRLAELRNNEFTSFDLFEKLPNNIDTAFISIKNMSVNYDGIVLTFTSLEYDKNDLRGRPSLEYEHKVRLPSMQLISSRYIKKWKD